MSIILLIEILIDWFKMMIAFIISGAALTFIFFVIFKKEIKKFFS